MCCAMIVLREGGREEERERERDGERNRGQGDSVAPQSYWERDIKRKRQGERQAGREGCQGDYAAL